MYSLDEVVEPDFKPISHTNAFLLWLFCCLGLPGMILCFFWMNGYLGFSL